MEFHTKPSTWLVVASMMCSAFTTLPTFHNFIVFGINVVILFLIVFQAKREARPK